MKAEHIRGMRALTHNDDSPKFLREIAAQLAELNESVRKMQEFCSFVVKDGRVRVQTERD